MKTITGFMGDGWSAPVGQPLLVLDKYCGDPIAEIYETTPDEVEVLIGRAASAFAGPALALEERVGILRRTAEGLMVRKAVLTDIICAESGQTLLEAAKEVDRAVLTLRITAEEASRVEDTMVPIAGMAGGTGKLGYIRRHPLGVVCAITAFNSPLNTPVHKIAPALAAGNAVVLKAPTMTPIASAILCEVFAEAGLPSGWLVSVTGSGRTVGQQILTDPRPAFYHFTGSTEIGRHISQAIGLRQSSLELGSIAATLVDAGVDVEAVAADIVRASFAKAGQVCTSTQIVLAERSVYFDVLEAVSAGAVGMVAGDPRDAATSMGPMIAQAEASRVERWVGAAQATGALIHCGGERDGSVMGATVLSQVCLSNDLIRREVFGPVVSILPVDDLAQGAALFNALPYGLAVGVFTNDLKRAFAASETLRAGTVHVNSASSSRLDAMPFGGVLESGHGKEGPRYAIEEMTEERLILWHGVLP